MSRLVVLLRGVNLSGRRVVPMERLRALCERAGAREVRTLAASGNVVLTHDGDPEAFARALSGALEETFGFAVQVMVRTREELKRILACDPFGAEASDPSRYQVSFLDGPPSPEGVRALERAAGALERVVVCGREIHAWHPGGVGRSSLAKAISAKTLGTGVTARNRRVLDRLLELAEAS